MASDEAPTTFERSVEIIPASATPMPFVDFVTLIEKSTFGAETGAWAVAE